ncbi:hypothetical protein CRPA25_11650 [Pseudomonas aeruginosa]
MVAGVIQWISKASTAAAAQRPSRALPQVFTMVGTPFGMSVGYAVGRFVEARKQAGNQRLRMGTELPALKGLTVRRSRRFNETAMLVP